MNPANAHIALVRRILAVLAVSLTSACTTVYTPKPGEPTARARLVYPANAAVSYNFTVLGLENCPGRPTAVAVDEVDPDKVARLGMPSSPAAGARMLYTEVLIPAERPVVVYLGYQYRTDRQQIFCSVPARIVPKTGMDYEFEFVPMPASKKCLLAVKSTAKDRPSWRLDSSARMLAPDPTGRFRYDFCAAPR